MLTGTRCSLRLVREADLPALQAFDEDVGNRGEHFPLGVTTRVRFEREYREHGFWQQRSGMLVIVDDADAIIGHIEHFRTVDYLDEVELSYLLYSPAHRGRGIATEAVRLLSDHLFASTATHRIRLVIHPQNLASRRVAEKAGFTREGVMRGAWRRGGVQHDVELWSRLRTDAAPSALSPEP